MSHDITFDTTHHAQVEAFADMQRQRDRAQAFAIRVEGQNANLIDALRLIARDGCENYTGKWSCLTAPTERKRGARYASEAWCTACIAADAIDALEGGAEL